jgi:hypothetical protein
MRDYLYIWHDPEQQFLVASGLEFKDFLPLLANRGGVALIDHRSDIALSDKATGFDFVCASSLAKLAAEDIYSWGNFVWIHYTNPTFPTIDDEQIAELLFFAHKGKPLRTATFTSLTNNFLAYVQDDGWYLKLHYTNWRHVQQFIIQAIPTSIGALDVAEIKQGKRAFWLRGGEVFDEERKHDVDAVLNRRL